MKNSEGNHQNVQLIQTILGIFQYEMSLNAHCVTAFGNLRCTIKAWVTLKKDQQANKDDILGYMQGKIAKWWMPDDVAFVSEIPHTATGKIQKTALREQFKDYRLPTAAA